MDKAAAKLTRGGRRPQQFARFAAIGLLGTAAHYLILALLLRAGAPPTPATGIGAVAGALVNYRLNYRYTFRSRQAHHRAAPRFLAIAGIGWLLNGGLFHGLHQGAGWSLWLAQLASTALVLAWNFSANRWWTFAGEDHG